MTPSFMSFRMAPVTVTPVCNDGPMAATAAPPTPQSPTGASSTDLLGAIDAIGAFVAEFDPSLYSGGDAAALVTAFTRAERLCGAGKTLAATRAAESNRHSVAGHRSAAEWLAQETGESVGEAVDLLKFGQVLEEQPEVGRAYRDGRLSRSRARLVSGAVKANPKREHELVGGAERDTFRQLKERCLRAKAEGRSAEDAAKAYTAIHRSRRCRTWTDTEGAFRLDALLTPDAGAALLTALTRESDRIFQQARRSGLDDSPIAYTADALVSLVTGPGAPASDRGREGILSEGRSSCRSHVDPESPAGSDGVPRSVSGADADGDAEPDSNPQLGFDGRSSGDGRGLPSRPPSMVHLRVDLDALRRGSVRDGEVCEIPGVGPVPIETARALMGDAITELVITNGVDVTTVCHLGRSIPSPLRTALMERDPTCVVPGCDVRRGLEIDHWQISFADGGPATLENLARLCGHHHYLRTHRGFQLLGGHGRWRWERPESEKNPNTPKSRTRTQRGSRRRPPPRRT